LDELQDQGFRTLGAFGERRSTTASTFPSKQDAYDHFNAGLRMIPGIEYLFGSSRFDLGLVVYPPQRGNGTVCDLLYQWVHTDK
jgi:hypothetical protein